MEVLCLGTETSAQINGGGDGGEYSVRSRLNSLICECSSLKLFNTLGSLLGFAYGTNINVPGFFYIF